MSKVAPHNAFIEVLREENKRVIAKHYRATGKYTASQEASAYSELEKLVMPIKGIRPAKIQRIDEVGNVLYLEFVPGLNLFERITGGDEACLKTLKKPLMELFLAAKLEQICFDSDPSNILFEAEGMVLVDPVCRKLPLADFTLVVFMWGLIKVSLRNIRFWRIVRLFRYWRTYYREYCDMADTTYDSLNSQMVACIDLAIVWNKERNSIEGSFYYAFRRIVVIPIYSIVRELFRWNLVR